MVFFQAASLPGGPAARLFIDFVEAGYLTLFVSDAILAEVRDVLGRPRIRAKNPTSTLNRSRNRGEKKQRTDRGLRTRGFLGERPEFLAVCRLVAY